MKKFVKKLTAGLLAFAMTVSTYSAAFAAPENTGDTAANTDVITISEEAENTLEAAKALSSLNANYGSSESDQDSGAKAAIKDAIFNDYNVFNILFFWNNRNNYIISNIRIYL